jgi:hypothetical protein
MCSFLGDVLPFDNQLWVCLLTTMILLSEFWRWIDDGLTMETDPNSQFL